MLFVGIVDCDDVAVEVIVRVGEVVVVGVDEAVLNADDVWLEVARVVAVLVALVRDVVGEVVVVMVVVVVIAAVVVRVVVVGGVIVVVHSVNVGAPGLHPPCT